MKQAIKKNRKNANKAITKKRKKMPRDARGKVIREHSKFGTSKLEQDFAREFLDTFGSLKPKILVVFTIFIYLIVTYSLRLMEIIGTLTLKSTMPMIEIH